MQRLPGQHSMFWACFGGGLDFPLAVNLFDPLAWSPVYASQVSEDLLNDGKFGALGLGGGQGLALNLGHMCQTRDRGLVLRRYEIETGSCPARDTCDRPPGNMANLIKVCLFARQITAVAGCER